MEKRSTFSSKLLPYALLAPQLFITLVFFYWPASQAVKQSFFIEDAFGTTSDFVGFENYRGGAPVARRCARSEPLISKPHRDHFQLHLPEFRRYFDD